MKDNIYRWEERIKKWNSKLIETKELTQKNSESLLQYFETGFYQKSPATRLKNTEIMYVVLKKLGKDWDIVSREEMEKYINTLYNSTLAPASIEKYIVSIKLFYRIMSKMKKGRYPESVDWIEVPTKTLKPLNPEVFPSMQELKRVIETALFNERDKCILSMLIDTGCRISELANLRIRDLKEEENYIVLTIRISKTNQRSIICYLSLPAIKKWLSVHPQRDGVESYLFVNLGRHNHEKKLTHSSYRKILFQAFKRAGIEQKKCNPHAFRHLFVTRASQYFSNAMMNYWLGWSGKGGAEKLMSQTYAHFNWKSVVKPYFDFIEKENSCLLPLQCSCGYLNPNQEFCFNCGNNLKAQSVLGENQLMQYKRVVNLLEGASDEFLDELFKRHAQKKKLIE